MVRGVRVLVILQYSSWGYFGATWGLTGATLGLLLRVSESSKKAVERGIMRVNPCYSVVLFINRVCGRREEFRQP